MLSNQAGESGAVRRVVVSSRSCRDERGAGSSPSAHGSKLRGGIASRSDRHGGADQLPASRASLALLASLATLSLLAAPTRAADIVKADNSTAMTTGSSWVGGTAPGTSDTAVFDSTLTSSVTSFGTGGILSVLGVRVTTGSSLVNIDNSTVANYFGAFGGGIDMSAASRDLRVTSFQQQADHTWNVATGRTLTIGSSSATPGFGRFAQANGSVPSLVGGGTISISRATAAISLGDASGFTGSLATNGTTLALVADTAESLSFGGTLSGTTTISKTGDGTYELPGANDLGGSVSVSAGTLVLSGTNTFFGSALTKAGAGTLLLNG
jgi:autotransporter-associated beta strand protein